MFTKRHKFIKADGSFDSTAFLKLLEKTRKTMKTWKKGKINIWKWKWKWLWEITIWWISEKDVRSFINKLANLLTSWIDIKTALWITEKQVVNPKLKSILSEMRSNLNYWLSISDTLKQFRKYFDPIVISLVEVWEKTWTLPKVLTELEASLLETIEIKAKIKWAMIYPVILIGISMLMMVFMLTFILPKITESFVSSGVALPWLTQAMINMSDFMRHNAIQLIIWLVISVIVWILFSKTHPWQLFFHLIKLKTPIFWHIEKQNNVILFINSLSLLLNSWVLMLEALETTANILPNIYFKKDIIRIKNEVETWIKLSNAMWLTVWSNKEFIFVNQFFSEELVHMISVWEETWTISKSIYKVWVTYIKELKRFIANLMSALEPFIIVFVWAMVWTIVVAIMLPFFSLWKVIQKG